MRTGHRGLRFDDVVRLATALPGVTMHVGARARALKWNGKLLARFRDDDETLVLRMPIAVREYLRSAAPDKYFLDSTYLDYPYVLVRLRAVRRTELMSLLEEAYRSLAPASDRYRRGSLPEGGTVPARHAVRAVRKVRPPQAGGNRLRMPTREASISANASCSPAWPEMPTT